MKNWILIIASFLSVNVGYAQNEITAFTATGTGAATTFVTDYQALGINPANLGWSSQFEGKRVTFGFFDFGLALDSKALNNPLVRESFSFKSKENTIAEKIEIVKAVAESGIYFSADVNWIGVGVTTEKLGGFAFSVRDRLQSNFELNQQGGEMLLLGYNSPYFDQKFDENDNATIDPNNTAYGVASNPKTLAELFDGTNINFNWYREFNLGYGKRVINTDILSLYAGVGVKYLQGIGVLDIKADGNDFNAFSSFDSKFGIDYNKFYLDYFGLSNESHAPIGKGAGVDFGVNAVIAEKLKIGAALNGLGQINWSGKTIKAENKVLDTTYFGGLTSPNLFEQLSVLVSDSGLFKWEQEPEGSRTIATPAVLRLGTSYNPSKIFQVGADVSLPVNGDVPGSLSGGVYGVGMSVKPLPWFRFSAGYVTGENIQNKYPVGITFIKGLGVWESGIASRDIVSLFIDNGTTISVVTGFLRFRI